MKLFGLDTEKEYTPDELHAAEIEAERQFNQFVRDALFVTGTLCAAMLLWAVVYGACANLVGLK